MPIFDRSKRTSAVAEPPAVARLKQRFAAEAGTPIAELPCRAHASVNGEVTRMRVTPRSGVPSLEVVISDGTGSAIAVFTGRRSIPGIEHGRALSIAGVARDERGRRVMLNPAYTLLPMRI